MVLHCARSARGFLPSSSVHPRGAGTPCFPKGRAMREQKKTAQSVPSYSPDCWISFATNPVHPVW
jgi:hypothetical protein